MSRALQTLTVIMATNPVPNTASTATNGTGQQECSFQTPLGLHRVSEKIGAGECIGTVFKGRQPVRHDGKGDPSALITDRILWLEGLGLILIPGARSTAINAIFISMALERIPLGKPNCKAVSTLGPLICCLFLMPFLKALW